MSDSTVQSLRSIANDALAAIREGDMEADEDHLLSINVALLEAPNDGVFVSDAAIGEIREDLADLDRLVTQHIKQQPSPKITLDDVMDQIADNLSVENPIDPILLFAGDPPDYSDRLPDDWDTCEQAGTYGGVRIMIYRPRYWGFESGTFTIGDGNDGAEGVDPDNAEFEVEIPPEDIVSYRLVHPMWDDDEESGYPPARMTQNETDQL